MSVGRNDPCVCGSGKKYKNCCLKSNKEKVKISQDPLTQLKSFISNKNGPGFLSFLDNEYPQLSFSDKEKAALSIYDAGLYSRAEPLFDELIVKEKAKDPRTYYSAAFIKGSNYEFYVALKYYRLAYQKSNKAEWALPGLALMLHKTNKNEEAFKIISPIFKDLSIEVQKNLAGVYLLVLRELGKWEGVYNLLRNNADFISDKTKRLGLELTTLLALSKWEEAESLVFENGVEHFIDRVQITNLLELELKKGSIEEAIKKMSRFSNAMPKGVFEESVALFCSVHGEKALAKEYRAKELAIKGDELKIVDAAATLYPSGLTEEEVLSEHLQASSLYTSKKIKKVANDNQNLRLGFVSSDFSKHPVAFFLMPLLRKLKEKNIEVFAYYLNANEWTDVTDKYALLVSTFRSWPRNEHRDLGRFIQQDKIDVLFDLNGNTKNNALKEFCKRMAPMQVSYVGYPYFTCVPNMDYRIQDANTTTKSQHIQQCEKLIVLDKVFSVYDPLQFNNVQIQGPSANKKVVVFGCFNNFYKISRRTLNLWVRLLSAVPSSILKVKSSINSGKAKKIIKETEAFFDKKGIAPDRLIFLQHAVSDLEHIKGYEEIDIALDNFPYNGTTTTCEALWMGVPVLTLYGDSHRSRVSLSFLRAIGKDDWAASTDDAFIENAIKLASEGKRTKAQRIELRQTMLKSPLMNYKQYADDFMQAIEGEFEKISVN